MLSWHKQDAHYTRITPYVADSQHSHATISEFVALAFGESSRNV
jgi:hypothetical protein